MRNLFGLYLTIVIVTTVLLTGCKDYGEFTVAEREEVEEPAGTPLFAMDLTGIDMEFSIGSEAHARALPEADWPDPIEDLIDRERQRFDGALPPNFDLPVAEGCIFVGAEQQYTRFRRVRFLDRTLLFVTYTAPQSKIEPSSHEMRTSEKRLAILDESDGMRRYDIPIDDYRFELVRFGDRIGLFASGRTRLDFWSIKANESSLELDGPTVVIESDTPIDRLDITNSDEGVLTVVWLTSRYGTSRERYLNYFSFKPGDRPLNRSIRATANATNRFLGIHSSGDDLAIAWSDARFVREGFSVDNQSKLMVRFLPGRDGAAFDDYVLNTPLDDSDNALPPILATENNNELTFFWNVSNPFSRNNPELRVAHFNLETRRLHVENSTIAHQQLVSAALQQQIEAQRGMPIEGVPTPSPEECDQWRENLDLVPTDQDVITPNGRQNILRRRGWEPNRGGEFLSKPATEPDTEEPPARSLD